MSFMDDLNAYTAQFLARKESLGRDWEDVARREIRAGQLRITVPCTGRCIAVTSHESNAAASNLLCPTCNLWIPHSEVGEL